MYKYKNLSGDSPVAAYEAGDDFIRVEFKDKGLYLYNNLMPGADHIAQMKILAENGKGLATYINKNVRKKYATKER